MINRVASVKEVKGIRHKKSYWLSWTRFIPNGNTTGCVGDQSKMDGMHFLTLDRKAIRAKIKEYISKMEVGDDIDLYVEYENDDEQLMTLTKQESGVKAIIDYDDQQVLMLVPYQE